MATTSVTIAVTGTAGATIEAFTRLPGAAAVSGGTRTGSGNITVPALTVGLVYEIFSQEQTGGGLYGQPSQSIYVLVTTTSDQPTARCGAWMAEIRDLFLNSANFQAWIQTIDGGETTSGHVLLGYDPRTVPKDEKTSGPNAFIFVDSFVSQNELSAKTYRDTFDIVAEIVWHMNPEASAQFIEEVDFLCKIIDEFKAKGTSLSTTFGGEVWQISAADMNLDNINKRSERRAEIRFGVRAGTEA